MPQREQQHNSTPLLTSISIREKKEESEWKEECSGFMDAFKITMVSIGISIDELLQNLEMSKPVYWSISRSKRLPKKSEKLALVGLLRMHNKTTAAELASEMMGGIGK